MSAAWQLDATTARLIGSVADARIDLSQPDCGLAIALPGVAPSDSALQILEIEVGQPTTLRAARLDAYVRGPDLVATYDEAPPAQLRTQSYWRILESCEFTPENAANVFAAFDLILSVSTSLLDNNPQSRVSSHVPPQNTMLDLIQVSNRPTEFQEIDRSAAEPARGSGGTGCIVCRLANTEFSFVQMVHPVDFAGAVAGADTISHPLFHERLEKGVILRARVRAAILRRENDLVAAQAAFIRFARAEPPLTV